MWTAVAVGVMGHVHQQLTAEEILQREELELRENNPAVKDTWVKYRTLKMLLDPAAEDALAKYYIVLALSRK